MAQNMPDLFTQRVSEGAVARVLDVLSTTPNRRDTPRTGDKQGNFDFWFDGGACRVQTGRLEFEFLDGTAVHVGAPIPVLSLTIRFPDGRQVRVQQEAPI